MKLRERRYASGKIAYQVDFGIQNGKRDQRSFKTKSAAETALANAKQERKRFGDFAPVLSPVEAADFVTARARLAAVGASVQEAVDYFLKHAAAVRERVTVPELVRRFIATKKSAGKAKRGIETVTGVLGSLARWLPEAQAVDVTHDHIEDWLRSSGWSARTQNKRVSFVSTLFRWAKKKHLASRNPCEGVDRLEESNEEIGTLNVDECRLLLDGVLRIEDPTRRVRVMCYVALGLFRGLRRTELERLHGEELDLQERTIIIKGAKTKTRQRRVIDIPDVAMAWLLVAGADVRTRFQGCVVPSNLRDWWPEFRESCGVKRWPHNAMRHTFASMHYAMHQNESELQAIMGHRSAEELHQHYRALKTKAEAAKFWALRPPKIKTSGACAHRDSRQRRPER